MATTIIPQRATSPIQTGTGDRGIYIYSCILVVGSAITLMVLGSLGISFGPPFAVAALSGVALWAERQSVRLSGTTQLSVAFLPLVFSAVAFGPIAAMVVGATSLVGDCGSPYV